jgi:3-methyladenine DNA glycosylase Tag
VRYHDEEWGRPVGDDRRLFEKICLEGFQAGLSWLTILRKGSLRISAQIRSTNSAPIGKR